MLLGSISGTNRGTYLGINLDITLEIKYELELVAVTNVGLLFAIALR